ncbi:MAG TPA: hypothetical protein VLJ39_22330, partial [Tepidisphaeraceae bacterium]|nr:hypothetical protein [Tepidisphaeraceae bacterium]
MESTKLPPPPLPKRRPATTPHDEFHPAPRPVLPHDGQGDGHDEVDMNVTPPRPVWLIIAAVVGIVAMLSLLLVGLLPREQANKELTADAEAALDAPVPVNVIQAKPAAESIDVPLPGNLRPWQETSIYARTTGYLKVFYADISNQVQAGQLMAVIETPEVDQQLRQAQANLLQAQAAVKKSMTDRDLSKVTYGRYEQLRGTNSVTQQDLDTKKAALDADEANVASAEANVAQVQANVQRFTEMQNFEKVTAPFAGVVT